MADLSISSLESRLSDLEIRMDQEANRLNLAKQAHQTDYNALASADSTLRNDLNELSDESHDHYHELAAAIQNHSSDIHDIQIQDNNQEAHLLTHDRDFEKNAQDLRAMDVEHHNELHRLANGINNLESRLQSVELVQLETPEHVIISLEDYTKMPAPDRETLYFCWEEED